MATPVVTGVVALMLQANPTLTPNAVKAILQYTAQTYPGYKPLEQGAGFLNAVGAVRLARFFATAQAGQTVPTQKMWSKHIIWGNHELHGGLIDPAANAFQVGTNWGVAKTDANDNIVWGTDCGDCDNIIWGTAASGNIVWGTAATATTSSGAPTTATTTSSGARTAAAATATTSSGAPTTATTSSGARPRRAPTSCGARRGSTPTTSSGAPTTRRQHHLGHRRHRQHHLGHRRQRQHRVGHRRR